MKNGDFHDEWRSPFFVEMTGKDIEKRTLVSYNICVYQALFVFVWEELKRVNVKVRISQSYSPDLEG